MLVLHFKRHRDAVLGNLLVVQTVLVRALYQGAEVWLLLLRLEHEVELDVRKVLQTLAMNHDQLAVDIGLERWVKRQVLHTLLVLHLDLALIAIVRL